MIDALLEELLRARRARIGCALVTVAATKGSVPRESGAKMLVYASGKISGTIGGGKFEALAVAEAQEAIRHRAPVLKTYPLHENDPASFGAICGGEVTILIEPQNPGIALYLVGGGHCSRAIAHFAWQCGMSVVVLEDREEALHEFPSNTQRLVTAAPAFISAHPWQEGDALLLVSRNYQLDHEALAAAMRCPRIPYIGMIGSERKVRRVFEALRESGISDGQLRAVYAPLGLDIGADSPEEIALSVLAEVLQVIRGRSGEHLRKGMNGAADLRR